MTKFKYLPHAAIGLLHIYPPRRLGQLDELRLVKATDLDYTINELINVASNYAEKHGIKPDTICYWRLTAM